MPTQDGLGLEDFERVECLGEDAIESDKQQSIDVADGNALRRSVSQYIELMSKDQVFGLQCCARPEESGHRAPNQSAEIAHWSNYQPIRGTPSVKFEFPVGTSRPQKKT